MSVKKIISGLLTVVLLLTGFFSFLPNLLVTAYADTNYAGTYYLESGLGSGMVLDVAGGKTSNRANIQIYKKNGTNAQQFKVTKYGSYYYITNVKSGKALDVAGGGKANKANIQQYTWNKTKAQLWKIQSAGNGYF